MSDSHRGFEEICKQNGMPVTIQRRVVYETIMDRKDHPSADAIYEEVDQRIPGISRTTVYRILDKFVAIGLVRKINHSGASFRFDPVGHHHHHLVCTQCNRIIDLEVEGTDRLPSGIGLPKDFEVRDYTIEFIGLCSECRPNGGMHQE